MSWWLQVPTGLLLVLSLLLSSASTAALPNRRQLLQYPPPAEAPSDEGFVALEEAPSDPYSSLLEKTIAQQDGGNYWDVFMAEDVRLVTADEPQRKPEGKRVSVDARKDGREETDLDSMTARSPYLKSLEDEENEEEERMKAMMMAWNIFEQDTIEKSTAPTIEENRVDSELTMATEPSIKKVVMTTPAAHPSYSSQQGGSQPWQSPILQDTELSDPEGTAKPHLTSLVENQMDSYFPMTGDDSDQTSSKLPVLGQVQKSLAKALRQDVQSLYSLLGSQEEEVLDNVKALYEDYSILKNDDPLADAQSPMSIQYKEEPAEEKKNPVDLKQFFAKYDLEVDADMMQDKILAIFQQNAEPQETNEGDGNDEQSLIHKKKDKHDSTVHFHQSKKAIPAKLKSDNRQTCTKSHDLSAIFKNLDFEVDADKMEETLKNYHDKLTQKNKTKQEAPQTTGRATIELKKFVSNFDFETDAEEVTSRLSDFHNNMLDSRTTKPTSGSFEPYFTEAEKEAYDSESIEDFYTRFYSLKGTVIHPLPLVASG